MPRIQSEIMEEFLKSLNSVGGIEALAAEESPEIKKYRDSVEARMGSDDISSIEAMYGVKPETIDSMEYEQCIMEAAHPDSVYIAPAYDKINGLVENNIERSNIMQNIVMKHPDGNYGGFKYAKQELVMELVRVANEMDARNREGLFKLADECLMEIADK